MEKVGKQVLEYTWKTVNPALDTMKNMFDLARLVDSEECREISVLENGKLEFGKACYAVWNADYRCANCTSYQACHTHQRKNRVEHFNGKEYQIQSVPVRIELADATVYSCNLELINFSDYSAEYRKMGGEQEKTKDSLETKGYLSTHDKMTGILNWDGFCKQVRALMMEHPAEHYLVLSANIQNFKLVNSLFGRNIGDSVLIEISEILQEFCGTDGVLARIGGDSFAVCIPKREDMERQLLIRIKQIRSLIESPSYHLNIHFGVYEVEDINIPISIMSDRAYMALQTIRGNREKNIAWFDDTMLKNALHEQKVISDFENNLRSGQFVIYLQPQVNRFGNIEGAECLVRWILPEGKMIPPFEFIGILEQSDLIASLDKYVWELAAKQLSRWKGSEYEKLYLSVNVSPQDFYYVDVADTMISLCEKYNILPEKLHVEITETALANETQGNRHTIELLQKKGFLVEIDDFGKGSSSLSLLKDIKADVLKIDMGFLRQSENNARGNIILETVIDMAKRLNMEVISEGVETEGQLKNLTELGCNMFQGYYFSKPVPVAAFEDMVKDGKN